MTLVLIEASLRSLLAGLVVAIGLRVFRVHNVVAQKAAWGLCADCRAGDAVAVADQSGGGIFCRRA